MRELAATIVGNLMGFLLFTDAYPHAPGWVPLLAAIAMGTWSLLIFRERTPRPIAPELEPVQEGRVYVELEEVERVLSGFHDVTARPARNVLRGLKRYRP